MGGHEQNNPAYAAPQQEQLRSLLGISPEGWTAIFTGMLTISTIGLWWVTYTGARDGRESLRTVERAVLVLGLPQIVCN